MKANSQKEKTGSTERPVADITDNALKNYEQAVRTGLKMQEEATKWWTNMWNQSSFPGDWQKGFTEATTMSSGIMPLAQRRMQDMLELIEKNNRAGADLLKKAVDAAQTPALAESQAKWMEFWTSSLGAVRQNTEAVTEISSKAIDSWLNYVRKNTEAVEGRFERAA